VTSPEQGLGCDGQRCKQPVGVTRYHATG